MANEIFFSYKSEDKEIVKAIKNGIDEKIGAGHCWMDIDGIETGVKDYESPLYKAIQNSSVFLFMISERSVDSEFCLDELDWAIEVYEKDENKHLVFVLIDPSFQLKGAFKRNYIQRRDIIDYNDSDRFAKLIRDLRKWLDIPEVDPLDEVRKKVEGLKADYNFLVLQQETIDKEIREQQKLLGETENECPVCGKPNEVEAQYCQRCGYILNYFAPRSFEDKRLRLLRLNWASNREVGTIRSQLAGIKNQLATAETETERLQNELKAKEDLLQSKDAEIQRLKGEMKQSSERQHSIEDELKKSQSEYAALKQQYDECMKFIEEARRLEAQKNSFCVVLKSVGPAKLQAVKEVKEKLGLGLKEAKELVDSAPTILKKGIDEATAKDIKVAIEGAGAEVEIICDLQSNDNLLERKVEEPKLVIADEEKRKAIREFTVNGLKFKMILVEGGTFQMGATNEQETNAYSDEKPAHSVTLSDYYIGKTEVTQDLWEAVMGSNPSYFEDAKNPVECVSWDDCRDFITKLNTLTGQNFRLPTEAEWEFAARGGNKSQHYRYSGGNEIDKVVWYDGNSDNKTHSVGSKEANELGLYDMSGNVLEWCEDLYGEYDGNPQINPKGAVKGSSHVIRGGGWDYYARHCRVSYRNCYASGNRSRRLGLRLAL